MQFARVPKQAHSSAPVGRQTMAASSKTASNKVERAVHKQKRGTLKTGSGKKVTSRKQAVAIGLSEARKKGAKVPAKRDG